MKTIIFIILLQLIYIKVIINLKHKIIQLEKNNLNFLSKKPYTNEIKLDILAFIINTLIIIFTLLLLILIWKGA